MHLYRYNTSKRGQLHKRIQYLKSLQRNGIQTAGKVKIDLEVPAELTDSGKIAAMHEIRAHKVRSRSLIPDQELWVNIRKISLKATNDTP